MNTAVRNYMAQCARCNLWYWPSAGHSCYPVYTPQPLYWPYQVATPDKTCRWFEDKGNEHYMYFTSCGFQADDKRSDWAHCPKCGGKIIVDEKPKSTADNG